MRRQFLIFTFLILLAISLNVYLKKYILESYFLNITQIEVKNVTSQKLFESSIDTIKKNYIDKNLNGQNLDRWKKHYKGYINTDEDANIAINSVLETLDDPYSRHLSKKIFEEQNTSINSNIVGIGVNISTIGGKTYIVNVLEETPAEKAGLKDGDIIVKVDDEDVTGLNTSDVASRVRGEINTVVKLSLLRNKKNLTKKITRKNIKIKNVKSKMYDDIGYIQVLSFIGASTYSEFLKALDDTTSSKGLIIDLRGNSGGLLPNAINMANVFINKGKIVNIVGRNGYKKIVKAEETPYNIDKPIVLLVDGNSASASEIFSGALKDHHKCIIVGTKTFGKGLIQRIIPLPNSTGMNLTIAKYLTPNDIDINKKGIVPDLKVPSDIDEKKDIQLQVAKNILKDLMPKN